MQQIADFHIHSRFSRACSRELTLKNLDKTGRIKGVQIIGTGDFTHPEWFREMETELIECKPQKISVIPGDERERGGKGIQSQERNRLDPRIREDDRRGSSGLYYHRDALDDQIKFTLTSEVALIYKDDVRVRRLHLVIHGPNIAAVKELNTVLGKRFNLKSDGRPILGISAPDFIKLCLEVDPRFLIYPAHIWTPWFSVFGSKSGFDSFEECFKDQTGNIYAFETGLSSDPEMNWRIPELDKLSLLSNSDAHSLQNIGREANILELQDFTYEEIYQAIKTRDVAKLKGTIEFYPEEGMYHADGHRDCKIRYSPQEYEKHQGICPICGKPLTIGVANRVEQLAKIASEGPGKSRQEGFVLAGAPGSEKLIELDKVIAEALGVKSRSSVRVKRVYSELVGKLGDELSILRTTDLADIAAITDSSVAEAIRRMRSGELIISPGFDGQYGEVSIFSEEEKKQNKQKRL